MATQKGRNWSSGDIVTAANLSSIERGVSAVAEEYTPTTWANGNTVTAAGLNNIEQGIANASGGSSDFSTAQVTVVQETLGTVALPVKYVDGATEGIIATVPNNDNTVVLYKGLAIGSVLDDGLNVSVSGNADYDSLTGQIFITGDCTITMSDSSGGQIL